MKAHTLVSLACNASPPLRPGLTLAEGSSHNRHGAWIHGALTLPASMADDAARWLRAITLCAISETNQLPQCAALAPQEALLSPPAWARVTLEGAQHSAVYFSIHSADLWPFPLHEDRYHVHAACDELTSNVATFAPSPDSAVFPWSDAPGDALLCGYDLARMGHAEEALRSFWSALSVLEARNDLDAAHLYNAACVAARAADARRSRGEPHDLEAAASLDAYALQWIGEDLALRCAAHTRASIARAVSSRVDPPAQRALDGLLHAHVTHLRGDPDLASLRRSGDLERVLNDLPLA